MLVPFILQGGVFTGFNINNNSGYIFGKKTSGISESSISRTEKTTVKSRIKSGIFEWLEVFSTVIVAVVLLMTFVFKIATIEGKSMQNTLFAGEKVIITNLFYTPKYGDIVVISRNVDNTPVEESLNNLPIIKRVIATAGQTVGIDFEKGIVYVDGNPLSEPYTKTSTNLKYDLEYSVNSPVTVPQGYVFVLGDNRNESHDSRSSQIGENGMIDVRYIIGHAVLRVFPFNKIGGLE